MQARHSTQPYYTECVCLSVIFITCNYTITFYVNWQMLLEKPFNMTWQNTENINVLTYYSCFAEGNDFILAWNRCKKRKYVGVCVLVSDLETTSKICVCLNSPRSLILLSKCIHKSIDGLKNIEYYMVLSIKTISANLQRHKVHKSSYPLL